MYKYLFTYSSVPSRAQSVRSSSDVVHVTNIALPRVSRVGPNAQPYRCKLRNDKSPELSSYIKLSVTKMFKKE